MKVSQINETSFTCKSRRLNPVQLKNVREIAEKINRPPTVIHDDNNFNAVRIGYVESKYEDVFFFNDNKNKTSEIVIGKMSLVVDRASGKVTKVDKPFLMPFKLLLREAGEYFEFFNENFDYPAAVKKNCLMEQGFVDESDGKVYITDRKWIRRK